MFREIDTAYFGGRTPWPRTGARCRLLLRLVAHIRLANGLSVPDVLFSILNPDQLEINPAEVRQRCALWHGIIVPCAAHASCDVCGRVRPESD